MSHSKEFPIFFGVWRAFARHTHLKIGLTLINVALSNYSQVFKFLFKVKHDGHIGDVPSIAFDRVYFCYASGEFS
jgi:hypothetical protein